MSEGILRMLAEREQAKRLHEAARRRALWRDIGNPREIAFKFGFNLIRDYLDPQTERPTDPKHRALAEGMAEGMMNGFCGDADLGWKLSDARKEALIEINRSIEGEVE